MVASHIVFVHVKHVVGGSEDGSNDFFENFLTGFAEDSAS